MNFVDDSLCVGLDIEGEVEVVLLVKLKGGEKLSDEKMAEIKSIIRKSTTPRHVPGKIFSVPDIPYTRSGKKMELLVSRILNKRTLQTTEAVANPDCLKYFEEIRDRISN